MRYGRHGFIRVFVWGLIGILWSACRIPAQTLPPEALEARYRIQVVAIADQKSVEFAEEFARKYSKQFGMRAYVIHKEAWYKVLLGDFSSPKRAHATLKTIKKYVKDAWPVAPDNDKVISIWKNGKHVGFKETKPAAVPTPMPTHTPSPTSIPRPTPIPTLTPIPIPTPMPTLSQPQATSPRVMMEQDVVPNLTDNDISFRSIVEKEKTQIVESFSVPTKIPEVVQEETFPLAEQSTKTPLALFLPEAPEILANLSSSNKITPTPLPGVKEVDLLSDPHPIAALAVLDPTPRSETSQEFLPNIPDENSQDQMPLLEFSEKQETVVPIEEAPVNTEITEIFGVNSPAIHDGQLTTDPDLTMTPIVPPDSPETGHMPAKSNIEKNLDVPSVIPETQPISEKGLEPPETLTEEPLPAIRIDDLNLDAVFEEALMTSTEDLPIMVVSPDSEFFLTSSHEKELHLWEKASGIKLKTFAGHAYPIVSASFSPDGAYIISAARLGNDGALGEIRMWERETGKEIASFRKDIPMVDLVGFSDDGQYAYHDASGERVWWDLKTGKQVQGLKFTPAPQIH